jgi:hypothetical protein
MKKYFKGKIRLVLSMIVSVLFVAVMFSSAVVKADADWDFTTKPPHMFAIPTGNIGIGVTSPLAKFHVKGGAVLFSGTTGGTPTSGAGTRLMWIPSKSAFRAGYVDGTQWNNANIGLYSVAMGYSTKASGRYSTAMGYGTLASGYYSTAMGEETTTSATDSTAMGYGTMASGIVSTAMGWNSIASGICSTAMGGSTASGNYSTAMGISSASGDNSIAMGGSTASGDYSTAMGAFTTASGSVSTAMGTAITVNGINSLGIGLNYHYPYWVVNANHVMSVMGGNVGIGTTNPQSSLHVNGAISLNPISAPPTPTTGFVLYCDLSDGKLKAKSSSGTVTVLANP